MNWKSEKGYTGIDIAIAIVVLFIFVSLLAFLSYSINSSSKEIELKSEATAIAVEEIEKLKNTLTFNDIQSYSKKSENKGIYAPTEEMKDKSGFYKTVIIEDYADDKTDKILGLVKILTVKIEYTFRGKTQSVELSTIFSKEN